MMRKEIEALERTVRHYSKCWREASTKQEIHTYAQLKADAAKELQNLRRHRAAVEASML